MSDSPKGLGIGEELSPYARGTNHLLAIAIDEYQTKNPDSNKKNPYPKLNNCLLDAEAIIKVLTEQYDFDSENVNTLFNEQATREGILEALDNLHQSIKKGDNLIVLFSGHGQVKHEMEYWVPVNAKNFTGSVNLSEVKGLLDSLKAQHIVVLADACFSGLFFGTKAGTAAEYLERDPSRYAITAGRNEPVSDGQPGQHSPFAGSLLYKLKHNEEPLGVVSLAEYVVNDVTAKVEGKQTPRHGEINLTGNHHGQYFFYPKNYNPAFTKRITELEEALALVKQREEEAKKEREDAEVAQQTAEIEKQIANDAKKRALRRGNLALMVGIIALIGFAISFLMYNEAQQQREKVQAVLDKIYFYDDKFGLAYDKKSNSYGFINRNLDTLITFSYTEAFPFNKGYAKVKLGTIDYLIDTLGNRYNLVEEIDAISMDITALNLSQKKINYIPEAVWRQPQLKILLLDFNNIDSIPYKIENLKLLRTLDLGDNSRLNRISSKIKNLKLLKNLDLSYTGFSKFPIEILYLDSLQSLDLGYTNLRTVPPEIKELKLLQSLDLSNNELDSLPENIVNLPFLERLYLGNNNLVKLPKDVNKLKSLRRLELQGNSSIKLSEKARIRKLLPNKCIIIW